MSDRYRKCRSCGDYHWESEWPHNHVEPMPERSLLPRPYYISDSLPDLRHPQDSRIYDSKSAFRATTERMGGIEIGNDPNPDRRWVDHIKPDDIAQAKQMVDQGYKPRPDTATAEDTKAAL